MTQRTERIDELLREEITTLLAREIADPRIGFATVTDVETAPDLRHARVWVSVIGPREDRVATVRALERAMPFVRHELGRRLRLRRIPEFSVRLDDSIERGSRVMQLLSELEAGGSPDELPEGESLPTPGVRVRQEGEAPDETDDAVGPDAAGGAPAGRPGGRGSRSKGPAGPKGGTRASTGSTASRSTKGAGSGAKGAGPKGGSGGGSGRPRSGGPKPGGPTSGRRGRPAPRSDA